MKRKKTGNYLPVFFDLEAVDFFPESADLLFEAAESLDFAPLFDLLSLPAIAFFPASSPATAAPISISFPTSIATSPSVSPTLLPLDAFDFFVEDDFAVDFEAAPLLDLLEEFFVELPDLLAVDLAADDFAPDDLPADDFELEAADLPLAFEVEPDDLDAAVLAPADLPAEDFDAEPEDLAVLVLAADLEAAPDEDFAPADLLAGAAVFSDVAVFLAVDFLSVVVEFVAPFAGFLVAIIFSFGIIELT